MNHGRFVDDFFIEMEIPRIGSILGILHLQSMNGIRYFHVFLGFVDR
jgi:hypothetical protein